MRTPRLEAHALTLVRDHRVLARDLSLTVSPGRPLCVTGGNGVGKSTLLRVLAGMDQPTGGWVRREGGERVTWVGPQTRLPEDLRVGAWIRLAESVSNPASGHPREEAGKDPLAEALRPPRIRARQRVGHLSTGERKRLLLWAALRTPGSFLVLDEPFAHLSPGSATTLLEVLRGMARDRALVLATNRRRPDRLLPAGRMLHLGGVDSAMDPGGIRAG